MAELDKTKMSAQRRKVYDLVEATWFKNAIMGVIIFNAIALGLSTSDYMTHRIGGLLSFLDNAVLTIFVGELLLKFYAYRMSFFRSAWNIFDLAVVGLGLLPSQEGLSALRGLRVIRAMRLLSVVPQMRSVVQALLDALPGMGAVIVMISIVFYVFGVMATLMYGNSFDEWFGTLGRSLYSLFQIMTLESWSMGIVRPVMIEYPSAWAFFVPFIVVTAFSVLNLFIGLLVNTMQGAVEDDTEAEFENLRKLVRDETDSVDKNVLALMQEVRALREELHASRDKGGN
ncbi:Ion transport protein [Sulfitobacter noctilucicola]|uniref:Voltage-gated sodium channel n=1 Tax=Sulfitobacter noctilucicola TaxID=1342301 RepID=A0A7W6Q7M0_9RHOB|nr:Ion transport protein [Sulfitobacter noctilucicola]MBB4176005.1 voltage-gated sodium channel [Sulfitobacter noctilucicola]